MEERKKEVLRYLGYGKKEAEKPVMEMISSCLEELEAIISPVQISREYPLKLLPDNEIDGGCFFTKSSDLSRSLQGCGSILLFAATLGIGADYLIHKYSRIQMSRAVVLQAAGAALIEEYCNASCKRIAEEYKSRRLYLRPRFSPGYGDFSLSCQPDILNALEAGKRIGIKLTDSFLMMPSKSVSAVIGISNRSRHCPVNGCETCEKTNCLYRCQTEEKMT